MLKFESLSTELRGPRWRSWWRHSATSRKVAVSIPSGVIGIFHWHILSGRTMALRLTQPLTYKNTRNIYWGKGGTVLRADKLTTFMCRLSWNLEASPSWKPQGLSRPVMGLLFLLIHRTTNATFQSTPIKRVFIRLKRTVSLSDIIVWHGLLRRQKLRTYSPEWLLGRGELGMTNWKEFGRKRYWSTRDFIPTCIWWAKFGTVSWWPGRYSSQKFYLEILPLH
jgi:hypothetical protein